MTLTSLNVCFFSYNRKRELPKKMMLNLTSFVFAEVFFRCGIESQNDFEV